MEAKVMAEPKTKTLRRLRIVHFMRQPRRNAFSIERLYEDVRSALPEGCVAEEWVCRNPSKGVWPRLLDAWAARKAQADVNHVTGDTHYLTYFLDRKRTILTIHDLVSIERSRGLKRLILWLLWFWLPVWRSSVVVTISEETRRALLRSVRCDPSKVVVIHNPVSDEFQRSGKAFNKVRPRVLQIGTKTNKNIDRVARSLSGIECELVVVGQLSASQVEVLNASGVRYESCINLSRSELLTEYMKADLLMFASTYEGFGLPIVEANAVGLPVITSNLAPMPEVAGDAALFVDPFDIESIRRGVVELMQDTGERDRLVAAGLRNAQRFSSQRVAEQYAAVYRRVVS